MALVDAGGVTGHIEFEPCCGNKLLINARLQGLNQTQRYHLFLHTKPFLESCHLTRIGLPFAAAQAQQQQQQQTTLASWQQYLAACQADDADCALGDLTAQDGGPFLASACGSGSCFSALVNEADFPITNAAGSITHLAISLRAQATLASELSQQQQDTVIDATPPICSKVQPVVGTPPQLQEYTTHRASFRDTPFILGQAQFWQPAGSPAAPTAVFFEYRYLNALQSASTGHTFAVHENPVGADADSETRRCRSAGSVFDPAGIGSTTACTPAATAQQCPAGSLSPRHLTLNVATEWSSVFFLDSIVALAGNTSIDATSLVVNELGDVGRLACATITAPEQRTVTARIAGAFAGSVQFDQTGAAGTVTITVDAQQVDGSVGEPANVYVRVHELPLDGGMGGAGLESCNATGAVYNPHDMPLCSGASGPGTPGSCAAGDIGGRTGGLGVSSGTVSGAVEDGGVTLFGTESIAGRSVVLVDGDGAVLGCGSIGFSGQVKTLVSRFVGPAVYGTVTFRQLVGRPESETSVLVDLSLGNGDGDGEVARVPWHVSGGAAEDGVNCEAAGADGSVFDPFGACGDGGCGALCGSEGWLEQLGCAVGGLSSKHGDVVVGRRHVLTDAQLPLAGDNSIEARGVVVGDGSSSGCGRAMEEPTREVRAAVAVGGVTGDVVFSQEHAQGQVTVTVSLGGVEGVSDVYVRVHELPLDGGMGGAGLESCNATGAVYNPHDMPLCSGASGPGTPGSCAAGDIGGRTGGLGVSSGTVSGAVEDGGVTLFGTESIAGRSVVLVDGDGAVLGCGSIGFSGQVKTLVSRFVGPAVYGTVTFRQLVGRPESETSVLVDLSLGNGDGDGEVARVPWHVSGGAAEDGVNCEAAGADGSVFDPFGACGDGGCGALCGSEGWLEQLGCAVGGLSSKHGDVVVGRRHVLTDAQLPLAGDNSIQDRSVLVVYNASLTLCRTATLPSAAKPISAVVHVSSQYLQGSITLSQLSPFSPMVITAQVTGADVSVTAYDMVALAKAQLFFGERAPCVASEDDLKLPLLSDIGAFPVSLSQGDPAVEHTDTSINGTLYGRNSLLGRSLALTVDGKGACGRISHAASDVLTASATFAANATVSGVVFFEQDPEVLQTTITVALRRHAAAGAGAGAAHVTMLVLDRTEVPFVDGVPTCHSAERFIFNPTSADVSSPTYASACLQDAASCAVGKRRLSVALLLLWW